MPKVTDIPACPVSPAVRSSGRVTREYQIFLITPLFGGGVEAGVPDETMPIRATSIRGQLQFWWRATRGGRFENHRDLFARHAEIWGTTEKASPVEIDVRDLKPNPVELKACAEYEWNPRARQGRGKWDLVWKGPFSRPKDPKLTNSLSYVLFPFQGKEPRSRNEGPQRPPANYISNASWLLRLRFPEAIQDEVEAALNAWVNFGGLGARTRRGCGALFCEEFAPKNAGDLERWFQDGAFKVGGTVRDWPTMPDVLLVGEPELAPSDAWKEVISFLQKFRQGEEVGRNKGSGNRPGRSRYPEPETIRRVTARRSSQYARLAHIPDDAFPRAEFGLPIVFHFQGQGEPPDTVLYPSDGPDGEPHERMASPLILKPLALADGKAVPLIMRLAAPPLAGVKLKGSNVLDLPGTTAVRASRLATYRGSPLAGSTLGSAVEAFLTYARKYGFREITR